MRAELKVSMNLHRSVGSSGLAIRFTCRSDTIFCFGLCESAVHPELPRCASIDQPELSFVQEVQETAENVPCLLNNRRFRNKVVVVLNNERISFFYYNRETEKVNFYVEL